MNDGWYIHTGKGVQGPFPESKLARYAAQGRLKPDMRLSRDRHSWASPEDCGFVLIGERPDESPAPDPGESGIHPAPSTHTPSSGRLPAVHVRSRLVCPHCLETVSLGDLYWISQHEQLRGDPVLGDDAHCRFLPSRFTPAGKALDAFGFPCDRLACPRCRLELDRALTTSSLALFSIVGAPSSGKSYFLGALTWQLRRILPATFKLVFADLDPEANRIVNQYEERLFYNDDPDTVVTIPKTTKTGDLYRTVQVGEQVVTLPRPFLFSLRAGNGHPSPESSHVLVVYDNAGEHFYPGKDNLSATRHLGRSSMIFFLFDPLQDPRFRQRCRTHSSDLQLLRPAPSQCRQETILLEAAARVRRDLGLAVQEKHQQPLVVVVTKCDVWRNLLPADLSSDPWLSPRGGEPASFRRSLVRTVSAQLRQLLLETTPELVTAAESFAEQVRYIPVSALGTSPVPLNGGEGLGVRVGSISPIWVTVPLLYGLSRWAKGLIQGDSAREESRG